MTGGIKRTGCVFWITGLPGAGKSTISTLFYNRLKEHRDDVILLDGDTLRNVLGVRERYSYEERKELALVYSRLCQLLALQGHHVVIATISMFHACQQWNRDHQPDYVEVYLRVPQEELIQRDQKKLYSQSVQQVVGKDILPELPLNPHLILENHGSLIPEMAVEALYQHVKEKI